MRKVLTIQIARPELDGISEGRRRQIIDEMSRAIAEQIIFQESMHKKSEDIKYWQQKLIDWQIEDHINEIKHGRFKRNIENN